MMEIIVTISLVLNLLLLTYVFFLLRKMFFISGSTDELIDAVDNFSGHASEVYNKDTYYGDETLGHLLSHARLLHTELQSYKSIYSEPDEPEPNPDVEDFEADEEAE